jgi:23S rRNA pseudouridine1911/1915/1917 synthase
VNRIRETVPAALAGERIDRVVALVTARSRAEATAMVGAGSVWIDGRVADKGSVRVSEGEVVEIDVAVAIDEVLSGDGAVAFTVVHADDDVIVIDKPAGLVVHPGAGHGSGTLVHGLLGRFPDIAAAGDPRRPGIVHRLDKETSGLLVAARTPAAYDSLVAQLAARAVVRRYLALVWGTLDAPRGMIDAPIGRSARMPTRMAVSSRGREARTSYEVVTEYAEPVPTSLLRCGLETGRTHQIRVHLAAIGHPVVGDRRYGGHKDPFTAARRFFLHAERLAFDHPRTGEHLTFESPLPDDLVKVLSRLA